MKDRKNIRIRLSSVKIILQFLDILKRLAQQHTQSDTKMYQCNEREEEDQLLSLPTRYKRLDYQEETLRTFCSHRGKSRH